MCSSSDLKHGVHYALMAWCEAWPRLYTHGLVVWSRVYCIKPLHGLEYVLNPFSGTSEHSCSQIDCFHGKTPVTEAKWVWAVPNSAVPCLKMALLPICHPLRAMTQEENKSRTYTHLNKLWHSSCFLLKMWVTLMSTSSHCELLWTLGRGEFLEHQGRGEAVR